MAIQKNFKRVFDITIALILVIPFLSFGILISFFIVIFMPGPIFFVQDRIGKYGKIFKLIKFRTMTNQVNEDGKLLPSKDRLTPFGNFLRQTSLDELPELFNVLNGTMSLVGPRPLLVSYKELYTNWQLRRHEVLPGITGLAQINGRNLLSWEERFEYDVHYVDNWNLFLDVKIILITIFRVLSMKNTKPGKGKIMERFRGTKPE